MNYETHANTINISNLHQFCFMAIKQINSSMQHHYNSNLNMNKLWHYCIKTLNGKGRSTLAAVSWSVLRESIPNSETGNKLEAKGLTMVGIQEVCSLQINRILHEKARPLTIGKMLNWKQRVWQWLESKNGG